jgi:type I restriction enzyme S subunit
MWQTNCERWWSRTAMSDWVEVELGEVLTLQRGFDLPKRVRNPGPYPVVSSSGVTGSHDEFKVNPPGVVIGRYGSLGSVHWVAEPFWPLNTALWVKDFKGNDPRFVSFLLETVAMDGSAAAAVPGVNRNHLHKLLVRLPGLATQRQIAAVLSAIDDLIEINERRIELLEALVRATALSWVRPRSETPTVLTAQAQLPQTGWRMGRVADLGELYVDGVDPSEFDSDDRYIGLEHLPRRSMTLKGWGSIESVKSRKLQFQPGDTLFAKIRPNLHKVAWVPFAGLASSDAMVFRPCEGKSAPAFLAAILASDAVVAEAVATANGTQMPRANPEVLLNFPVRIPDDGILREIETVIRSWLDWCAALAAQNAGLKDAQDLLLLRLVTGQLDISDIDLGVLALGEPE